MLLGKYCNLYIFIIHRIGHKKETVVASFEFACEKWNEHMHLDRHNVLAYWQLAGIDLEASNMELIIAFYIATFKMRAVHIKVDGKIAPFKMFGANLKRVRKMSLVANYDVFGALVKPLFFAMVLGTVICVVFFYLIYPRFFHFFLSKPLLRCVGADFTGDSWCLLRYVVPRDSFRLGVRL